MHHALELKKWNLNSSAERLLGTFVATLINGKYLPDHHRVLHNRKIGAGVQQQIAAYIEALTDTGFGQP